MKGVIYRHTRLMPGSTAFALHEAGDRKKLDAHMIGLEREAHDRGDVPYATGGIVKGPTLSFFELPVRPAEGKTNLMVDAALRSGLPTVLTGELTPERMREALDRIAERCSQGVRRSAKVRPGN